MVKANAALFLSIAILSTPAWAESGEAFRGRSYADAMCASCHAVSTDGASANAAASPFRSVKLTDPTADAFATWLNTKHPSIPNRIITVAQADDLAAYIASLTTASSK